MKNNSNAITPKVQDRLADFNRDQRLLMLSLMASVIGAISAGIAYVLVWLIGLITNLAFYQRLSADFVSPADNHLGFLAISFQWQEG